MTPTASEVAAYAKAIGITTALTPTVRAYIARTLTLQRQVDLHAMSVHLNDQALLVQRRMKNPAASLFFPDLATSTKEATP